MKKTGVIAILVIAMGLFTHPAWGALAEPVSPGGTDSYAVTAQVCPTFSWSAGRDAVAYRIEVYELVLNEMSHEQMRLAASPVVSKEISAPAFAWTPPVGGCLAHGVSYIWYVQGINDMGEGSWSEGRVFSIESEAFTAEQKESVQEVVRQYLETTTLSGGTENLDINADSSNAVRKTTSGILEPMTVTEGSSNTRLGLGTGNFMPNFSTGSEGDTFIGFNAGYSNITGWSNSFVGQYAGYSNYSGNSNSVFGSGAGYLIYAGNENSFFGASAGFYNNGSENVFIGYEAGYWNFSGSGNVFIGHMAGGSADVSNRLYISNSPFNPLIYGEFDNNRVVINGSLTMTTLSSPSDERYKRDIHPLELSLEKVLRLQGVSYEWKTNELKGRGFKEGRQIGLIAQETEKILPEIVQTDEKGYKTMSYDKLVAVLIEAVKEQQSLINQQKSEMKHFETSLKEKDASIEKLTAMFEELSARIAAIEIPGKTIAVK